MTKIIPLKCPGCNANIEIESGRKQYFCQYCGTKILVDDSSRTYTHVHIDKTREKEIEFETKKFEYEQKKEKSKTRKKLAIIISMMISLLLAIITFLMVKEDFSIKLNFIILLIGSIIAMASLIRKEAMMVLLFTSLVFSLSCIMFMISHEDFSSTFMIAVAMAIILNIIANAVRSKKDSMEEPRELTKKEKRKSELEDKVVRAYVDSIADEIIADMDSDDMDID